MSRRTIKKNRTNTKRFLLASYLYVLKVPMVLCTVALLGLGVYFQEESETYLIAAGVSAVVTIFVWVMFIGLSAKVQCKLCRAQFLRNLRCSKKKHAPKILGNYNLPVSLAIITKKSRICCPYCGEKRSYFDK